MSDSPAVPGFQVLREIGRGAMGVVYLAHETALGREVALKVLRTGGAHTEEARARFEREVRAAGRINHPNIVPVHSTGEAEGRLWYAMPYVEGRSLDRLLRESQGGRLAASRAVRIVLETARTLHAAHRAGVVHRDVKPGNVMLVEQPPPHVEVSSSGRRLKASWLADAGAPAVDRPLLVDFGLASDGAASSLSVSGDIIGTPSHMSPEQFRGRSKDVGPAADQWALGVILYEALTGRLPFPAHDLPTLARSVCEQVPVPPSRLEPDLDRDLETIVLKCLEKDAQDRYPDCAALAEDLGAWLRESPISARPPGPVRRVRTWARHHRATAAALVVLVAAGVAAAAIALGLTVRRAARIADRARAARPALDEHRFSDAEEAYGDWVALDPEAVEPREGRDRARALLRLQEAEAKFEEARRRMEGVRAAAKRLDELRARAEHGRDAPGGTGLGLADARGSEPWWMREPAYRASVAMRREAEALTRERAELADLFTAARSLVEAAYERAGPEGAVVKGRIDAGAAAWHMEEWRRAVGSGDAEAEATHRVAVLGLDPKPHAAELAGDGVLVVTLLEKDARAWLFRYEREDEIPRGGPRLLPLPYDLARGATSVPDAFRRAVEDRLRGEDPAAVQPDTPSVTEPFGGNETHVGTMAGPMSRERYARLLDGTAYPLVLGPENEVALRAGAAEVPLPRGSWLLRVQAPGRAPASLPFEVPRSGRVVLAPGPLPAEGDVPRGFVRVPGGAFPAGGDEELAVQPMPAHVAETGPFLVARYELTFADWWEFLNDPRTLREIEEHRAEGLRFVPRIEGEPIVPRDEERGTWTAPLDPERPLAHVSLFDVAGWLVPPEGETEPRDEQYQALSDRLRRSGVAAPDAPWGYLKWRTLRSQERARTADPDGGTPDDVVIVVGPGGARERRALLFTLPTVLEWERAARGGDRRAFVYGDEREWLCFKGARSRRTNAASEPIGLFAEDESVFGVRDLTGSVAEWTCDWREVGGLFWTKGSSWASQTPEDDRIASRRALSPSHPEPTVGVRLVVRTTEAVR